MVLSSSPMFIEARARFGTTATSTFCDGDDLEIKAVDGVNEPDRIGMGVPEMKAEVFIVVWGWIVWIVSVSVGEE